jgi:phosphoribosylaminoimidazole-succinocarboxamide synthase
MTDVPTPKTSFDIPELKKFKSGKVREVYDLDDTLLLVASDRISAYDCVMPNGIPQKGMILNQLSAWWFEQTRDIMENHMISTSTDALPEGVAAAHPELKGRILLAKKTQALSIECIVRGYLIGSGWKEYQQSGSVCGIRLRDGYQMADKLDAPIFTPSDKAETGHDENITFEDTVNRVGEEIANQLRDASLALYRFAAEHALKKGIIIADTKFEFGLLDGKLILIDEALTPDSSRFWPADSYKPGSSPFSYDKQYVRDYLSSLDWDKTPPAPELPADIVVKTREKYLQAFEQITGAKLAE